MKKRAIFTICCALFSWVTGVLGFSTHNTSLSREVNKTVTTTGAQIVVTCSFTNHESATLRGFFFTDHIPSSLSVTTTSVRVDSEAVDDFTSEQGADSAVYPKCTPCRWILEQPTGFFESNAVASNAYVEIVYSVSSATSGTFHLNEFSWGGYYQSTSEAAFGYSVIADQKSVTFLGADDISALHSCDGYWSPGSNKSVSCEFSYPTNRLLWGFKWTPGLLGGWTLESASGDGSPDVNGTEILFTGSLTNNPIVFSYVPGVPAGTSGWQQITGDVDYWLDGEQNHETTRATPDPLRAASFHTLVVTSPHGGAVPAAGTNTFTYGTNLTCLVTNSPVILTDTQYVSVGWQGEGSVPASGATTNTGTFEITNDSHIVWLWQTNYWLDTSVSGSGSVDVADEWVASGSNVVITASADDHYHFVSWSGDTNGCTINDTQITAPMNQPRQITANFEIDMHELVVASPHGNPLPPVGTNEYPYGTNLTCTLPDSPVTQGTTQYVCIGWSGTGSVPAGGADTNIAITLTNDSSIAWNWKTEYWFTVTNDPGGEVTADQGWHDAGSNVTAQASPLSGFLFSAWVGDVPPGSETNASLDLLMDQARSVTAEFAADTNHVWSSHSCPGCHSPGTNALVSCSFSYPADQTLTSLVWQTILPDGWRVLGAIGHGTPSTDGTNVFLSGTLTNNPVVFDYRLGVPGNQPVTNQVGSAVQFRFETMDGPFSIQAGPAPLWVPRYHSADYREPYWHIDGTEANRVLAYARAGGYYETPLGLDGYAPTNAPDTGNTTGALHSADYQTNYWVLDSTEVNRALAYWRNGSYSIHPDGDDDYAPIDDTGSLNAGQGGPGADDNGVTVLQTGPTNYSPGETLFITNTFICSSTLLSLGWLPHVPDGWQVVSVAGDGTPELQWGEILWVGTLPPSPMSMRYEISVPLWELGTREVRSDSEFHFAGMINPASEAPSPSPISMTPADSDNDGLPDGWENHYSGGPTNMMPAEDDDQDGMSNLHEHLAGTNPTNALSLLTFTEATAGAVGPVVLRWTSETNRSYSVERTPSLFGEYTVVSTNLWSTPPTNIYMGDQGEQDKFYYRISLE